MQNPLPETTAALRTKQGIRGLLILVGFAMMLGSTAWSAATWIYEYWDYIVVKAPPPSGIVALVGFLLLAVAAVWKCSESEAD